MALFKEDYCGHSIFPEVDGPDGGPFHGSFAVSRFDDNHHLSTVRDMKVPGTFDTEFAALEAAMKAARRYVIEQIAPE